MEEKLKGKVALVTGSGSGIGRATALTFAREGAKVIVADIAVEGGEETMQMIKKAGGDGIFVKTDVSKAADVEAMVNKAADTYGQLDYAHNNAGIVLIGASTTEYSEEDWDRTISINLKGVWLCMKYEIPQMLKHGGGAIVNTSSVLGLVGIPDSVAYVASKHGVVGLTKVAALEYVKKGIRVNAVCPGGIMTPSVEAATRGDPQLRAKLMSPMPIGRFGTSEEIAEAVVWLCSDAASFITGQAIAIDGGWSTY